MAAYAKASPALEAIAPKATPAPEHAGTGAGNSFLAGQLGVFASTRGGSAGGSSTGGKGGGKKPKKPTDPGDDDPGFTGQTTDSGLDVKGSVHDLPPDTPVPGELFAPVSVADSGSSGRPAS